jgi:membrane-bound serine protease (ClpP class)
MRLLKHSAVFDGFFAAFLFFGGIGRTAANTVEVLKIEGAITPVTAKYIGEAIRMAEDNQAECLVIQMDTPGGLMDATWTIDKSILASLVPVIVYISPAGGRAASAGVYISYAAHLIAMAPSTHLGSAHPVTVGGQDSSKTMMEKITNDAVAHIKGLAEKRGRNAQWAEQAVRESVSITETEAMSKKVVEITARDLADLLGQLDGRTIRLDNGVEKTLRTKDAGVRHSAMDWRYRILDKISDPNIAYILMMLGIYGLFSELSNPGAILPGVIGGIFLILAFFALQVLSANASGVLLILLALLFFFIEVKVNSHGLIALGGIVSMVLGSMMLFKSPVFRVSIGLILFTAILTAAFFLLALAAAIRTHRMKPTTGKQGLIGETGEALRTLDPDGQVSVHGEIWKATCTKKVRKGETVVVVDIDGLTLKVKPK